MPAYKRQRFLKMSAYIYILPQSPVRVGLVNIILNDFDQ